ncbi:MAG: ABC transporter ATP-binding protein [Vicinamibacteria bacterium]|nr:ABC transporter ATP-binding protein [Vicinamibacteria bacterium]
MVQEPAKRESSDFAPLLAVNDLVIRISIEGGDSVTAVRGISFSIAAGESLALVGESGCGKSMTALSLTGLLPRNGRVVQGTAFWSGRDLLALPADALRRVRGRDIGMVFQDPTSSLNPVLTIGQQLTEGMREHRRIPGWARLAKAIELLQLVGIPDPETRLRSYPHEFSGGQRQRILIAMAIACQPRLLVADEPTTALDATIQAQIVELLKGLQKRLGMAILWITHDLALVAGLVDRVAVMYAGLIVEQAPVRDLFNRPRHPYTLGLLNSMPQTGVGLQATAALKFIPGTPPDLRATTLGCSFAPRCSMVLDRCRTEQPARVAVAAGHESACFRAGEL